MDTLLKLTHRNSRKFAVLTGSGGEGIAGGEGGGEGDGGGEKGWGGNGGFNSKRNQTRERPHSASQSGIGGKLPVWHRCQVDIISAQRS